MSAATDGFAGKRITVMGLGRFGGGAGVVRWLCSHGAQVLLTDQQNHEALEKPLAGIADLTSSSKVALRLGEHREEDFQPKACDLIIANPAVPQPWTNRYLRVAHKSGVPITTELRLTIERLNRQRTIGVTGSAGKSTTAAMIHHILSRAGLRAHLGGNIGGSLLGSLDSIGADDGIVLELSSAMLWWLGEHELRVRPEAQSGWSPHVAVLTNLSPNHLDWHGTFEHYQKSKRNIFRFQHAGDHQVTSAVEMLRNRVPLRIPGEHNQLNARLALAAVEAATGISAVAAAPLLEDFPGLPHRLQLVAERDGMRFFNDSKSTTPEATLRAVAAFDDPSKIRLIAGGYDKKIDLAPIATLSATIAGLYTIGATGEALAKQSSHAEFCATLDRAVDRAMNRMKPGDVLLLSPGCASWDQFTNFEERGEAFEELVVRRAGFQRDTGM